MDSEEENEARERKTNSEQEMLTGCTSQKHMDPLDEQTDSFRAWESIVWSGLHLEDWRRHGIINRVAYFEDAWWLTGTGFTRQAPCKNLFSMDLKNLFTVAQFIKTRCEHGLKAGVTNNKNYVFFEVEILDPKSKTQLCFLDKVEPSATIAEIKCLFHKNYPNIYPSRQALKLHPAGKALSDDDVLEDLPVGTTATMFFQDLGPQIGWTMVFLAECFGPLFVYLLFYFRLPFIYRYEYNYTQSPFKVVRLACWCHSLHYIKKLAETIFIHRFSHGTLPVHTILLLCLYYWGFAAWQAYYINHPLYTPASYGRLQIYAALVMFLVCELGNLTVHVILNRISCNGSRPKEIPYPTRNPFTWLFFFVSCPNYTYEVCKDTVRE
ncbi:hypothetical protein DNTS_016088 [Danionella cerebrum]|uniref:Very-long-chain enoyl-CoA reductase n=1 Tax=Danionella cerebrum TaxID=2873325 RepID=A0A553RQH3_9TELE|nr:hypothetical protein DNTS_016088 [Danionella translucida]